MKPTANTKSNRLRKKVIAVARFAAADFGVGRILSGLALALMLTTVQAEAQNFSVDWFKIAGGGGRSTGGVYSASGTVGQPDAGKVSGGNFAIEGGFWGILGVVQTSGAPLLSIRLTATNTVAVSWPSPSADFLLQQNTNGIGTVNWSNVTATINDDGTIKTLIVSPPTGNRFYRLFKP